MTLVDQYKSIKVAICSTLPLIFLYKVMNFNILLFIVCHLPICRCLAMFPKRMWNHNSLLSIQQLMVGSTWQTSRDGIPNTPYIYNRLHDLFNRKKSNSF